MIRTSLLAIYVTTAALYVGRDWFKSLCALILLLAVIEHPDMPKSILGIQGLNPWNLLLAVVFFGWLRARKREGLPWDFPRGLAAWLCVYLGVVLVGWVRMVRDPAYLEVTTAGMISEHLINTIKWVVPAFMLYDGARNRERFRLAMFCVLAVYALFALQVIRWMPLSAALSGGSLSERSLKILVNEVGFHRVNMSAMLAGASWAIFAARPLADTAMQGRIVLAASAVAVFGQALTAGRAGYVTWIGVGGILCLLRWRKYLLLAPVLVAGVLILAPGVAERMLEGFGGGGSSDDFIMKASGPDVYTITAGRNLAWPLVIAKIKENPIIGYGRESMTRTGTTAFLAQFGEGFSHPHNAYLEMLLDNGVIGFLIVVPFYLVMLWRSVTLFLDSRHPVFVAIGGVTCAFLLALLIAAMGSQTFYPREGWAGMWCALFLMLRVHTDRARWLEGQHVPRSAALRAPRSRGAAQPQGAPPRARTPVRRPAAAAVEVPVIQDFISPAAVAPAAAAEVERPRPRRTGRPARSVTWNGAARAAPARRR